MNSNFTGYGECEHPCKRIVNWSPEGDVTIFCEKCERIWTMPLDEARDAGLIPDNIRRMKIC